MIKVMRFTSAFLFFRALIFVSVLHAPLKLPRQLGGISFNDSDLLKSFLHIIYHQECKYQIEAGVDKRRVQLESG
jgi:hypothetical protein